MSGWLRPLQPFSTDVARVLSLSPCLWHADDVLHGELPAEEKLQPGLSVALRDMPVPPKRKQLQHYPPLRGARKHSSTGKSSWWAELGTVQVFLFVWNKRRLEVWIQSDLWAVTNRLAG